MTDKKSVIPVFFSCDDNYLPFLSVAVASLSDHASDDTEYRIYILNNGLDKGKSNRILHLESDNIRIFFVNVEEKIKPLIAKLSLRDYYTVSIYFRLFIPALFPEYDKAIYLDADIAVLDDVKKLYDTDLGDNLLGAVPDAIISSRYEFAEYAEFAVGVPFENYFNSGVLLMDLAKMREFCLEEKFAYLLRTYGFATICPDQDYLNAICRNRVLYLDIGWNKMSIDRNYQGKPMLVHYNMFYKPWLYRNIAYEEYFWQYADTSDFLPEILAAGHNFGMLGRIKNRIAHKKLLDRACEITYRGDNFRSVLFRNENEEPEDDNVYGGYGIGEYDEEFTAAAH